VGGYYVSTLIGNQSGSFYWGQIRSILNFHNIFPGVIKPFLFGFIITCISCYMGLTTKGGARGLSRSTTAAVVLSIIVVIISDFLITRALMLGLG
jgi:phospholipid/cholesterol/gamma-HCH transport system permease protein